ncbi:hypothetical protein ACFSCZ_08035 [Siminovitchia sediminis]|uniref:Uncharacterized protein n=1 Tax=Siminovitchia sediminis TaxID=1274353 RepID=A0ABW4KH39_9BACI
MSLQFFKDVVGKNIRAHHKEERQKTDPFLNPLIHRQIHGDEKYVSLDPKRLWGR